MSQTTLGKIRTVDPRTIWPTESLFTSWLAEHIELLNEALGLEIELVESEVSVGSFSVDLSGKVIGSGEEVVIENQLEPTDHTHLGQLLTYAAGREAKTIVWISRRLREEHRQAIDWLNLNTGEAFSFFGVELEVWQIGDSPPAPRLNLKAQPSEWQKQVGQGGKRAHSEREIAYHGFFTELLNRITSRSQDVNVRRVGYGNWLSFSTGRSGFTVNPTITRGDNLRVELYISTGNAARNGEALDQLGQQKAQIEAAIGQEVVFERMAKDCRIYVRHEVPVDPASPPDDALDWAAQRVIKFRDVFAPRVKNLVLEALAEEPSP